MIDEVDKKIKEILLKDVKAYKYLVGYIKLDDEEKVRFNKLMRYIYGNTVNNDE